MEFKLFENESVNDLYTVWRECFGDEEKTIDLFFNSSFKKENTLVAVSENKIIAQLFIIPARIYIDKKEYNANYLYALGTLKTYRKRGIMEELIKLSEKISRERNADFLFLTPASDELFKYYEKFGFKKSFKYECFNLTKAQILHFRDSEILESTEFNKAEFKTLRDKNLNNFNFVSWGENEISLENSYLENEGEAVLGEGTSFFVHNKEDIDIFYDLASSEYNLSRLCGDFINFLKSAKAEIHLPLGNNLKIENKTQKYGGMIKGLKENLPQTDDIFMGINLG